MNLAARGRASGSGPRKRRAAAWLPIVFVLSGCFATSKSLEDVQSDITRKNAWANEELGRQQEEVEELRSENEALRQRMDDLSDQFASLGGDVSTRLTELSQSDEQVAEQVRTALQSTGVLAQKQQKDREETLDRMNAILEEVLEENKELRARLDSLEKSAFVVGRMHKVKEGESVASIARKYGVSAEAIVEANDLSDPTLIQVGQDLLVPGTSGQ